MAENKRANGYRNNTIKIYTGTVPYILISLNPGHEYPTKKGKTPFNITLMKLKYVVTHRHTILQVTETT